MRSRRNSPWQLANCFSLWPELLFRRRRRRFDAVEFSNATPRRRSDGVLPAPESLDSIGSSPTVVTALFSVQRNRRGQLRGEIRRRDTWPSAKCSSRNLNGRFSDKLSQTVERRLYFLLFIADFFFFSSLFAMLFHFLRRKNNGVYLVKIRMQKKKERIIFGLKLKTNLWVNWLVEYTIQIENYFINWILARQDSSYRVVSNRNFRRFTLLVFNLQVKINYAFKRWTISLVS